LQDGVGFSKNDPMWSRPPAPSLYLALSDFIVDSTDEIMAAILAVTRRSALLDILVLVGIIRTGANTRPVYPLLSRTKPLVVRATAFEGSQGYIQGKM
jgi:hypothetical protein